MTYFIKLNSAGRVGAVSVTNDDMGEGTVQMEMPDAFNPQTSQDWRIAEGAPMYAPQTCEMAIPAPTPAEQNAAKIDYLAMMTGVEM